MHGVYGRARREAGQFEVYWVTNLLRSAYSGRFTGASGDAGPSVKDAQSGGTCMAEEACASAS